ncbi:MAG: hypothetical protein K0Q57_962 [Gammaproteobacteria bacterium]|jgi:RNA recognition motif-containing protein|nr:hypothetical protein [Gammaproteobacteria bacterium]
MVDAVYVGNLDEQTTETELKSLFFPFGEVKSAEIIMDRLTGKSRGFAFVKLDNAKAMKLAAKQLKTVNLNGKTLKVSCAIERTS